MAAACNLLTYDRRKIERTILAVVRSVTVKDGEEIGQIADAVREMTVIWNMKMNFTDSRWRK